MTSGPCTSACVVAVVQTVTELEVVSVSGEFCGRHSEIIHLPDQQISDRRRRDDEGKAGEIKRQSRGKGRSGRGRRGRNMSKSLSTERGGRR